MAHKNVEKPGSIISNWPVWMEHYVEQELAETTINTYKKRIRLYIKPYIGSYKLKNVQGETLAELHRTGMSKNTYLY